jgi:hypothetical protein
MDNGIVLLSVSSSWMDMLEVLASDMTGYGGGGLGQSLLQLLELCRRHQSVGSLATLPVTVKSPLDVSPNGEDTTGPWHLHDQVGIMWYHHKPGEYRPSQESIVHSLKIGDLKLYGLPCRNFPESCRLQEERSGRRGSLLHHGLCHGKELDWGATKT